MVAGINTAKAVRPMQEVMNQAHTVIGRRAGVMPFVRLSSKVEMKFKAPSNWPIQKMPMAVAQRTCPVPSPGPAAFPIALSGAYAVQPASGGPSPTKNAEIRTQKATNVVQKDIMLKWGNGISSAPTWMGRK